MDLRRVVICHGFGAGPGDHWFGWLGAELAGVGVQVDVPALPDSGAPDRRAWVETVGAALGTPDEHTAVVGHSLGAVTALHALDAVTGPWTLGAFVAVAGFVSALPDLPQLDPFTDTAPDLVRTRDRTVRRAVFRSDDDAWVPPHLTRELGDLLAAGQVEVPGAGHFLGTDGMTHFPQLATYLHGRRDGTRRDGSSSSSS